MSNTDSTPYYLMLRFNGEVAISHFIAFGLTLQVIKAMHCHSRGEQSNHFTMKVVKRKKVLTWKLQNISFVFHLFGVFFCFFFNFSWIVHSQQLLTYSYCAQYVWTIFVSFLLYLFCLFVVIYGFWSRHGNIWHDLCLFIWRNCLPYLRLFCKFVLLFL